VLHTKPFLLSMANAGPGTNASPRSPRHRDFQLADDLVEKAQAKGEVLDPCHCVDEEMETWLRFGNYHGRVMQETNTCLSRHA
jgi:hypothetical protein